MLEVGIGRVIIGARRTVGEAPLGDYTVEALLAMTRRSGDLEVSHGVCTKKWPASTRQ